jgi:very-short-patch-repair endonuclease
LPISVADLLARQLRRDMTEAERLLLSRLRGKQIMV